MRIRKWIDYEKRRRSIWAFLNDRKKISKLFNDIAIRYGVIIRREQCETKFGYNIIINWLVDEKGNKYHKNEYDKNGLIERYSAYYIDEIASFKEVISLMERIMDKISISQGWEIN